MHAYTGENAYREKAERTLGLLAGVAGQYGLFAGTYGIAAAYAVYPHSQVVIVGEDETAAQLYTEAASSALIGRSAIKLKFSHAVTESAALVSGYHSGLTGDSSAENDRGGVLWVQLQATGWYTRATAAALVHGIFSSIAAATNTKTKAGAQAVLAEPRDCFYRARFTDRPRHEASTFAYSSGCRCRGTSVFLVASSAAARTADRKCNFEPAVDTPRRYNT